MAPLMYFVFVVFYIIAAPIAVSLCRFPYNHLEKNSHIILIKKWCLDYTLGAGEGLTTYNKMELSAMIKIQQVNKMSVTHEK